MELSEGLRNMANTTKTNDISKADEILEVGQELIQTVGYDGFSYRDIADRVGIKSASVHYYFPAKTDLAEAVAEQYRTEFAETVREISANTPGALERLEEFAGIFQDTLENLDRVCLCGMLASESSSVPDTVSAQTRLFFNEQQDWIGQTIADGIDDGTIIATVEPDEFAKTFLSALEGAMMMARSMEQPEHLASVSKQMISLLRPATTTAAV